MTSTDKKSQVRDRMARTGENYTTALRRAEIEDEALTASEQPVALLRDEWQQLADGLSEVAEDETASAAFRLILSGWLYLDSALVKIREAAGGSRDVVTQKFNVEELELVSDLYRRIDYLTPESVQESWEEAKWRAYPPFGEVLTRHGTSRAVLTYGDVFSGAGSAK